MPRNPTQKHPIRDLRAIINKRQKAFAQIIGINPGTLKRIENNDPKLKLSRRIAMRIFAETGANVDHLLSGELRNEAGRKYSDEFYTKWKKRYAHEGIVKERMTAFAFWGDVLLQASLRKGRFWQVLGTLNETLDECCTDFGLTAHVDAILRDIEPRVRWNPASRTPAELIEIEAERERDEKQHDERTKDLKVHWLAPGGKNKTRHALRKSKPKPTSRRSLKRRRRKA